MLLPRIKDEQGAVDLATEFFGERVIYLTGPINDDVAEAVVAQLLVLESKSSADITIYIDSPGGSVSAGFAIYDTMQHIDCDVSTVGIGLCASMGAFLLASGTKGKRYALPNTQILVHQPIGQAAGQASDIAIVAEHIIQTRSRINEILAERTGQSLSVIAADMERDYWLWADEACEYGIIDHVKIPVAANERGD